LFATTLLFQLTAMLGCAAGSGGAASREPTENWNQQRVTELAGQLETAARQLYTTLYRDPEGQELGMENPENSLVGSIQVLRESATSLHGKLEAGNGRKATLGEYKRIKELSRDATEAAGFTDMAMDAKSGMQAIIGLLNQLDGYYGAY